MKKWKISIKRLDTGAVWLRLVTPTGHWAVDAAFSPGGPGGCWTVTNLLDITTNGYLEISAQGDDAKRYIEELLRTYLPWTFQPAKSEASHVADCTH